MLLHSLLTDPGKGGTAMRGNLARSVYCALATLLVALGSPEALSQSAQGTSATTAPSDQASSSASVESGVRLEEITVTATRREQSVEKVPVSIDALSQSDLTQGGIKNIADIAATVPGLQFDTPISPATLTTITIRGLNAGFAGAATVGVYLDDTPVQVRLSPIGNVGNPYPVPFDLNRVEVARGPQGTLFGAGAEAGTVRFISNEPSLTEFSGFSHAELMTTENGAPSYEIGAAAGGPIVQDQVGFRLSAWTREDGGYIDRMDPLTGNLIRNANKENKSAFRAALAFSVNEIRITPSLYYQYAHEGDSGRLYDDTFSDPSSGHFVNPERLPAVSTDELALPSVKIEASLPFAQLTSTTSYTHRYMRETLDGTNITCPQVGGCGSPFGIAFPATPADVSTFVTGQRLRAITQEVRMASNRPEALFTWVAGIFYDHRVQQDYARLGPLPPPNSSGLDQDFNQNYYDDQIAVYAQGDLHLTRQLTLTAGERVARMKTDLIEYDGSTYFGGPLVSRTAVKETPSTPRLALTYQADRNNLFYVSASKGFRAGGGNDPSFASCGNAVGPNNYKSDHDWSYEVGAKNTLFDGRLQVDSSVFHIDWSQIQQIVILPCGASYITNTGNAVSNGFDLALGAVVTERLRVNLAVGYANAYYTTGVEDQSGNPLVLKGDKVGLLPMVNAPWNVNTSVKYTMPLPNGDKIYLRGEYQYNSRNPGPFSAQIPTSPNYSPLLAADPPTRKANARVGYTRDKLDVSLFVNNVFNSHPLLGMQEYPPTSPLLTASTFRPRTAGLSVNYSF
ncbi:MAG: hypothetical protein JWN43_2683 [Gammaproteobacteria bacterium]|nr:hypothetical protein [Gammaproteobacteria bacterium]